jgi:hypothetical protein
MSLNMVANPGMTLDQFLATHFESPEPDFVDGEVVERSMPDISHWAIQGKLVVALSQTPALTAGPELRVKLRSGRSYIIDVCAYPSGPQPAALSG